MTQLRLKPAALGLMASTLILSHCAPCSLAHNNGLENIHNFMLKISLHLLLFLDSSSWEELLEGQPTLLKLTPKLGLDVQTGMDLLCVIGMAVSFMCVVFKAMRDTVSFILLWMLYLSLYQVNRGLNFFLLTRPAGLVG